MVGLIKSVWKAWDYLKFEKEADSFGRLDAVVASTGPKLSMDLQRADYAVNAVRSLYGSAVTYEGIWIAAGRLNQPGVYTGSQREGIVNRLLNRGADQGRIVQIDGEDTVDKIRLLGTVPEIKEGDVEYLGIASYPLHIARFNLALSYAQREGVVPGKVKIVGIETPTPFFYDTKPLRLGDGIAGWAGLIKDAVRLEKNGFAGSVPGKVSGLHRLARELNSEDRDISRR